MRKGIKLTRNPYMTVNKGEYTELYFFTGAEDIIAKIDTEDLPKVEGHNWHILRNSIRTNVRLDNGKYKVLNLARLLMNAEPEDWVYSKDKSFDFRKSNLLIKKPGEKFHREEEVRRYNNNRDLWVCATHPSLGVFSSKKAAMEALKND
jgi:hypothetical protein